MSVVNETLCSGNGACENVPGSYNCNCSQGFTGKIIRTMSNRTVFIDPVADPEFPVEGTNYLRIQGGGATGGRPTKGTDSFVLTYKFFET